MSKQPVWKYVGNLGDVTPIENDGAFVFVDETGVYCPELEHFCSSEHKAYRILLEKLEGDSEWFCEYLKDVADFVGISEQDLREELSSDDALERAQGYLDLINYFGDYEFDQYPLDFNDWHETPEERYERLLK